MQLLQLVCGAVNPQDVSDLCTSLHLGEMELVCAHAAILKGDDSAADKLLSTVVRYVCVGAECMCMLLCVSLPVSLRALEFALPVCMCACMYAIGSYLSCGEVLPRCSSLGLMICIGVANGGRRDSEGCFAGLCNGTHSSSTHSGSSSQQNSGDCSLHSSRHSRSF